MGTLETENTNDTRPDRGGVIAFGAILAMLTVPPAFGLYDARKNLLEPLQPGDKVRVAENPERMKINSGHFPRSGGLIAIDEREVWKFRDETGRVVAVPTKLIPALNLGDEVCLEELGRKIGEASKAHITIRGTTGGTSE